MKTHNYSLSLRILAPLMASLMIVLSCLSITGCSYSQAEISSAVSRVENGLKTTEALLPQAQIIQQDLQVVAPDVAEYIAPLLSNAKPALDKLIAACDQYQASPSSNSYQAILNGLDAITAQVDQAALKIAGIKNPNSQQRAATFIALVSTGLHLGLGIAQNYASKKQVQSMNQQQVARVDFNRVRPLLNRDYAKDQLARMGYSDPERVLEYAGF